MEHATEHKKLPSSHPMFVVLGNRNLRLLWIGEGISVLGSQFYLIAMPWLVLQLTGDPFKMGTVLALAGIPRALFILIGGALTDRFSPRRLMLVSTSVRMIVLGLLSMLVLTGSVDIWVLYLLSLTFGLADAFFFPAQAAILPRIVEVEYLLAGNSIVQGTSQLSIAVGPALAGGLIAMFSSPPEIASSVGGIGHNAAEIMGIGLAFGINTIAFLISLITIWMIRVRHTEEQAEKTEKRSRIISSIVQGVVYVFKDKTLRLLLLVTATAHFFMEGPLFIGIPVLADSRYLEGAVAFGVIMSSFGAGMLLGIILAGTLPKLPAESMGMVLLTILSLSGVGLILLGFAPSTLMAAPIVLVMGGAQGFVVIQYVSWIQGTTPEHLLGRIFSLLQFASIGLIPVSQTVSGALIKLNTTGLFVVAGILLTLIIGLVAIRPEMRAMGLETKESVSSKKSPDPIY